MCMCVCVYVCMCACVRAYTSVCITLYNKIAPTRYHFEYVYTNIYNPELYDYVENLEKWVKFNLKHQLYPDQSNPILDLQGE